MVILSTQIDVVYGNTRLRVGPVLKLFSLLSYFRVLCCDAATFLWWYIAYFPSLEIVAIVFFYSTPTTADNILMKRFKNGKV